MSVTNTPSKNGGRLTPPDKHAWSKKSAAQTHTSPSPARPYGQLIGSLDNSTYAEFWNRLDTNRPSPNQSNVTVNDPKPTAVSTAMHATSTDTGVHTTSSQPQISSALESNAAKDQDTPQATVTPDSTIAGKHFLDDSSANETIPKDTHSFKRFKQDATEMLA